MERFSKLYHHKYQNKYYVLLFEFLMILTYFQSQAFDTTYLIVGECLALDRAYEVWQLLFLLTTVSGLLHLLRRLGIGLFGYSSCEQFIIATFPSSLYSTIFLVLYNL